MRKIKIIGYVRVSSRKQLEGYSIAEQKRRIKKYCEFSFENYKLDIVADEGKSARSLNRSGMKKIIKEIAKEDIDMIIILKLDRLCRNLFDLLILMQELEKQNISLVSINEKIDTSSAVGKLFVHILGALVQFESDITAERTSIGLTGKCENGEYPFSKAYFGYIIDEDNKLVADPKYSDFINDIYEYKFGLNYNISEISNLLVLKYPEYSKKKLNSLHTKYLKIACILANLSIRA